jgi:hypothetical protein
MQMEDDRSSVGRALEVLQAQRRRLEEERRARAQSPEPPLAIRLRHVLDATAHANIGFPFNDIPDYAAGSFLQLESLVADDEARRGIKLDCYADAIRELAGKVPEFAEIADALDYLNAGRAAPLLRPRRRGRQNKPPEYCALALYAAGAFGCAAFDLHKKGEKLVVDRVMAEVFGEARTGTESYANNLGNPWLPLCGRHGIRRGSCWKKAYA